LLESGGNTVSSQSEHEADDSDEEEEDQNARMITLLGIQLARRKDVKECLEILGEIDIVKLKQEIKSFRDLDSVRI
jgi:hypothetical protein